MSKLKKNKDKKNTNKSQQYNSDNEIIIGVTTKPKKQRVEKKPTRSPKTKSKIDKKDSKKNKKSKKSKKLLVSFFSVLIIIIGMAIYMLTTPKFNITNIVISGNEKNDMDTYINLLEIEVGQTNIYQITKRQIEKELKQNPYVENVETKRKLPNTLQINITERKPFFQVTFDEKYAYIDNQGYVLEYSDTKMNLPILIGLESFKNDVNPGQRLIDEDLYKINTVFKILNYLKNNNISNEVTSIDVTDTSNYIINMDKDEKIIYLGDASNISERMNLLKTILERENGKKGKVFMNGDSTKTDVYFREEK